MRDLSRRFLLRAGPAAAVLATAPAAGAALSAATDPWVSHGAAYFRHRDAVNAAGDDDDEADRHMDLWGAAQNGLQATRPTTVAGVVAGLRAASADLYQFQIEDLNNVCPGIRFVKAVMDSAIAALEREAGNA